MESNQLIPIKNVYYMLSYAFQVLNEAGYKKLATEEFENIGDLCAAILIKGISSQIKRGLVREYIPETEALSSLKGRINISDSIKSNSIIKNQMVCTYDEFSLNSYVNRIIKTTVEILLKSDISKNRKKELRKLIIFFSEVEVLDPYRINWKIQYNRNNQTYQMLISICYLVIKGLLQSSSSGGTKLMDFFDEQRMCHLYEKFILEYYRKEHPEIKADALQIPWALADDDSTDMLPIMQTDITLRSKSVDRVLVIDAKYYSHNTQSQFGKNTIHSGNLYQVFTYVKNLEALNTDNTQEIAGMLLYAKTVDQVQPDSTFHMSGNTIFVKNLDLNQDFADISNALDQIANSYFAKEAV